MLVALLAGLFVAPFTVAYLLLYAAGLHLRRWLRGRKGAPIVESVQI
jgi:hypothetical protein